MIERSEIKANKSPQPILGRCLYCGHPAELIWVHGHGQCSNCGINTEECCRGESCAFNQHQ